MPENSFEKRLDAPATPANLRTTSVTATSITVAWNAVNEATSYEVWVTNTVEANAQPRKKLGVTATKFTAADLETGRQHRIQVYSVLDRNTTHLLSAAPAEKNTTTESVIVEDIVKMPADQDPICPLTCNPVIVESPGIVRWSAFVSRDFHKIRIKNRESGDKVAQILLERKRETTALHIINIKSLICEGEPLTMNAPSVQDCPAGTPPLSWCGSFPRIAPTVYYRIEADTDKCVVKILSPANIADYIIEADRCTTTPKE